LISINKDLALNDFNKAIELNPNNAVNYLYLGAYYHDAKEYELAIANYLKVIELDSTSYLPYINLADIYYTTNDYDLALKYVNQVLSMYPEYKSILL